MKNRVDWNRKLIDSIVTLLQVIAHERWNKALDVEYTEITTEYEKENKTVVRRLQGGIKEKEERGIVLAVQGG